MVKLLSCALLTHFRISGIHLFNDGLHLLESDMAILTKTFISSLNYFLQTHLHHPSVRFQPTVLLYIKFQCSITKSENYQTFKSWAKIY